MVTPTSPDTILAFRTLYHELFKHLAWDSLSGASKWDTMKTVGLLASSADCHTHQHQAEGSSVTRRKSADSEELEATATRVGRGRIRHTSDILQTTSDINFRHINVNNSFSFLVTMRLLSK
ncbi:hypothetical protein OESDEN_02101 [Oesophagostomum dentatum]|uniref:Uncharacterized protein n=1 Tax=Oesophagostomum dentatum TaxID=61180 RepID=A0A0B1TR98_OESDE|nr:hypothetical protein OESDEN_02101 [Oesophagostomum dentatum]